MSIVTPTRGWSGRRTVQVVDEIGEGHREVGVQPSDGGDEQVGEADQLA